MKKYLIIIAILSLVSCTKDLELPLEKADDTIVVNCLFSEVEEWEVELSRVKGFGDQADLFVEDAKVVVVPENSDTIYLKHTTKGTYQAEEKPVGGIQYQLIINDGHSKIITAKNSIPATPVISSLNYTNEKAIYFSNPNLSDYAVFHLSLTITGNGQPNFVRFRFYSFNTERGYLRYSVTSQTMETLRAKKLPDDFLAKLEMLIGVSMGSYQYYWIVKKISDEYKLTWNEHVNIVIPALKETKVNYRSADSFLSGLIFSNSIWLNNVSRDTNNALGEYTGTQEANLFVDYLPFQNKNDRTDYKEEYWLEVVGMSEDYYKYQKSYIKQVVNQSNPFASVIEVYSNITNGVGIFAGYNRQMIHFYDY